MFAVMGLLVFILGVFPRLRPPPFVALALAVLWLALPAWGLFGYLKGKRGAAPGDPRGAGELQDHQMGTRAQVSLFTLIMVVIGTGFFFWAKHLGVKSTVIVGSLLIIEGLAGVIVSMTEWWRLSHIGIASGLIAGGFLIPFTANISAGVPVGGTFFLGSLVSAGILYWQIRNNEASATGLA